MRTRIPALLLSLAGLTWPGVPAAQALRPAGPSPAQPSPAGVGVAPAGGPQQLSGVRLNRFVGFETETYDPAEAGMSQRLRADLERDQQPAAYGVAYAPLSSKADAFLRFGYGGARSSGAGPQDDAWRYGAGAQYRINSRNGVRAEYIRQNLPRSDVKANVVSLGFRVRF